MKVHFILSVLIIFIVISLAVSRGVRRRKHFSNDFELTSSGDGDPDYYFEVIDKTSSTTHNPTTTTTKKIESFPITTTMMIDEDDDDGGDGGSGEITTISLSTSTTEGSEIDDGVTCSSTNITQILNGYELDHHVLAIFKVNASANDRELSLFLELAYRFNQTEFNQDFKFVVICSDQSSVAIIEWIMASNYPLESIVVVDEEEDSPLNFGLPTTLEDLYVYIVDNCGKLSYIIVPPWSSAQHPYVKSALLSCFFDLPCGCIPPTTQYDTETEEDTSEYDDNDTTYDRLSSTQRIPLIDETDEIENIEDIINISNSVSSENSSTFDHDDDNNVEENINLRIILPTLHVHYDNKTSSFWKYEDILLRNGAHKSPYKHFHLKRGVKVLEMRRERGRTNHMSSILGNLTSQSDFMMTFVGNRTMNDIHTIAKSDQIFMDRYGKAYKKTKEIASGTIEIEPIDYDITKKSFVNSEPVTRHHYEQLNKWKNIQI